MKPDEIWLNFLKKGKFSRTERINIKGQKVKDLKFEQFSYIKYYQDVVIVVPVKIEQGKIVMKTWYNVYELDKTTRHYREGIPIKKGAN